MAGRKKNRNRDPVPTHLRVKMLRERQKKKKKQQQFFNSLLNESKHSNSSDQNDIIDTYVFDESLQSKLRNWASDYNISKQALDDLLKTLNSLGLDVPKNHRTLQKTPVNVKINEIAGGQFWYNGLKKSLVNIFSTLDRDISISLNFNVDGLPIFRSSNVAFWPILATIHGMFLVRSCIFDEKCKNLVFFYRAATY